MIGSIADISIYGKMINSVIRVTDHGVDNHSLIPDTNSDHFLCHLLQALSALPFYAFKVLCLDIEVIHASHRKQGTRTRYQKWHLSHSYS
jgi:hypothetical protein